MDVVWRFRAELTVFRNIGWEVVDGRKREG